MTEPVGAASTHSERMPRATRTTHQSRSATNDISFARSMREAKSQHIYNQTTTTHIRTTISAFLAHTVRMVQSAWLSISSWHVDAWPYMAAR